MTRRAAYRLLIALHPREFRERHGEEMLCVFDESAAREMLRLASDGISSIARQWFFHSGWWKFLAGAAASGILVLSCGYSISNAFHWSVRWGEQQHAEVLPWYAESSYAAFNESEFEAQAQRAVQMLASYRRAAESDRRRGFSGDRH